MGIDLRYLATKTHTHTDTLNTHTPLLLSHFIRALNTQQSTENAHTRTESGPSADGGIMSSRFS